MCGSQLSPILLLIARHDVVIILHAGLFTMVYPDSFILDWISTSMPIFAQISGMLAEIVAGSTLAFATGLTVVAFKSPDTYKKLCIPLLGLMAVAWIAQLEFSNGYLIGLTEERKTILELNKSKQIKAPKWEPPNEWLSLVIPGLSFYIGFLGLRRGLLISRQR